MLDRDAKELLIGFAAIMIFATAIVYFRQQVGATFWLRTSISQPVAV
jgi:hypothetical protein